MPRRGRHRTKTITTGGLACLSRIYNHPFGLLKMHTDFSPILVANCFHCFTLTELLTDSAITI
jgi:hypothetical protein